MVRNPCCAKMGLKKGPWTSAEDHTLVNYINQHGHDNWRALPKRAGLMRCGKSCRLRWMNYLRPGIKRGNFTREEEETIIKLHQELGNKWSIIASKLPGRTDNEIKNIWNTNLKKKLHKVSKPETKIQIHLTDPFDDSKQNEDKGSPLDSSNMMNDSLGKLPKKDESFWSDDFSTSCSDYSFLFSLDTTFGSDFSVGSADDFWNDMFSNEISDLPEFW